MATTNSQGVYNYGLILFESVLTVLCILGKASWTLVSMVALTPGTVCHQTIITPEKRVTLSSEYSQKSGDGRDLGWDSFQLA